jgi:hypothetical protein
LASAQHNAPWSLGTHVSLLTDDDPLADDSPTVQLWSNRQQLAVPAPIGVAPVQGSVLCSRYVLEQVIGRGGTSVIFRARDIAGGYRVALKLPHAGQRAGPTVLTRLRREFRQMQCLSHPGIAQVFDMDCDGELWFMCMELVAGQTAHTWMHTPAADTDALRIITECCEALEHAHSLGILHGDLKPTNVIVTDDGSVKLIDFGSTPSPDDAEAGAFDASAGTTPLYASPQILAGLPAERSDDVFSLACLSYSILSHGRHPFGGHPSFEDGRAKSAPTYAPSIPPALFEVIERGLSAERERRPASVKEFHSLLTAADQRRLMQQSGVAASVGDTPPRSSSPRLFRQMRLTARSLVPSRATGAALVALDGFDAPRDPGRQAPSFVRLIVAILAIVGATEFLQLDMRRDTGAVTALPSATAATSAEAVSTAPPQGETMLQPDPLLHGSGVISFEAPIVRASAGQSMVAISVKRLQATSGSAAFSWRVERGTAQPGVDYERVEPRTARFIEGQAVRTLFIPLIETRAASVARVPLTFTVTLERVAGGPALGRYARITVAIDPPSNLSRVAATAGIVNRF